MRGAAAGRPMLTHWNRTRGTERFMDVGVISFAIKLAVGYHPADRCLGGASGRSIPTVPGCPDHVNRARSDQIPSEHQAPQKVAPAPVQLQEFD
jgi:hypothetical protein